jgi:hypothetical protein
MASAVWRSSGLVVPGVTSVSDLVLGRSRGRTACDGLGAAPRVSACFGCSIPPVLVAIRRMATRICPLAAMKKRRDHYRERPDFRMLCCESAAEHRIFAPHVGLLRGYWGAQIVQFGTDAQPSGTRRWMGRMHARLTPSPGIFQAVGSDCPDGGGVRREMVAAASSLLGAPSLRRMWETWTLTVLTLMTSIAAISRLV